MNKPELLPTGEFTPVIDVAGFLTDGEVRGVRARCRARAQTMDGGCRQWELDGGAARLVRLPCAGASRQQPVSVVASKPWFPHRCRSGGYASGWRLWRRTRV